MKREILFFLVLFLSVSLPACKTLEKEKLGYIVGGTAILGAIVNIPGLNFGDEDSGEIKVSQSQKFTTKAIKRTAILIDEGNRIPVRAIEDEFIGSMLNKGYTMPSRTDLQKIMQEINFQNSGITSSDAAKLGKILNVPSVLIVSVSQLNRKTFGSGRYASHGYEARLSARFIDVSTSNVLFQARKYGITKDAEATSLLVNMSQEVANSLPSVPPLSG